MKTTLTKAFLVALPLASLLVTAPAAFAGSQRHQHHCRPELRDRPSYSQRWHEGRRYYDRDDHDRRRAPFYRQRYRDDNYNGDDNYYRGSYTPQFTPRYSPSGRILLSR